MRRTTSFTYFPPSNNNPGSPKLDGTYISPGPTFSVNVNVSDMYDIPLPGLRGATINELVSPLPTSDPLPFIMGNVNKVDVKYELESVGSFIDCLNSSGRADARWNDRFIVTSSPGGIPINFSQTRSIAINRQEIIDSIGPEGGVLFTNFIESGFNIPILFDPYLLARIANDEGPGSPEYINFMARYSFSPALLFRPESTIIFEDSITGIAASNITLTQVVVSGITCELNQWKPIVSFTVEVSYIDCTEGITDVCIPYCLTTEGLENCRNVYDDACLSGITPVITSETDDTCKNFYKEHIKQIGPYVGLDNSLKLYCQSKFTDLSNLLDNGTADDINFCACNMKDAEYAEVSRALVAVNAGFSPFRANGRCLLIECATSDYPPNETVTQTENRSIVCDNPKCINLANVSIGGANNTINLNLDIEQTATCLQSFNSGNDTVTEVGNGSNTDTDPDPNPVPNADDPVYKKWWFWLIIGIVIMFILIIIFSLAFSSKKKK